MIKFYLSTTSILKTSLQITPDIVLNNRKSIQVERDGKSIEY